ncbi:MAG: feruloyl-CoA synthase [Blastocatellia bacterium]|nr:feruloyl-CoA synthase [Blastocatellia bacterium]
MEGSTVSNFIPVSFLSARVRVERRDDDTLVLRSPEELQPYARCLGEYLEQWAVERPQHIFLAQRQGDHWRSVTYAETLQRVQAIATALLQRNLSVHRPVAILSENSIEHALLALAALQIGVPVVPISASYSLMSRDFKKLRAVFSLITPGIVFAEDGQRYASALAALSEYAFELVTVRNPEALPRVATDFAELLAVTDAEAVNQAFAAITPDTIAKFLLTSGSTGEPKAVINTQRMLCASQQALRQAWPFLQEEPPVLVDWLPWNHTAGGNNNFGVALVNGGSLYLDEGKPTPDLIEKTVRNLREISPTLYYNVPRGYAALLPFLETDAQLRANFFARLKVLQFSGAALPAHVGEGLARVATAELGQCVYLTSGYGATETAPGVTLVHFPTTRAAAIGLPVPGVSLKLVPWPGSDKYELRVQGDNVTPGYWKREDLTAAAFDDEGFYRLGDAARFVDANDPAQGIEFAGRVAEDFKLTSGTWVQVGAWRTRAISALAPVAQDIVITGHDRDEIGFLIFPSLAGCCSLCPDLSTDASLSDVLCDKRVRDSVRKGLQALQAEGGGSSTYATRALLLEEPPQIDAGEITDKGYINQRAVLERRAQTVAQLYASNCAPTIITLNR